MNVMIDLETLGNKPGSVIVALGAVVFSREGISREFYTRIDADSCVKVGLTMDPSTVKWWLNQGEEARAEILKPGLPLAVACMDFTNFLFGHEAQVWGNGAAFDNVLLAAAFRAAGWEVPWKFWNDRCFRTLKAMRPEVRYEAQGVAHNALDDARSQALHAIKLLW